MDDRTTTQPRSGAESPTPLTPGGPPSPDAARRPRLRKRVIALVLLPILLIGAGVTYWYLALRGFVSTDDAYIDANRVSISTEMLGRIVTLAADEGDTVHQGEVLVRLDDRDLRAQQGQAQAALEHAQASVRLAEVNVDRAGSDLERATTQLQGNAISQEQFDHAKTSLDAAEAQHRIALAQVGAARAQLGVIQAKLTDTQITAPFDGVVAKRWVVAGDVVQPGQPILAIYDLQHVWVTANLEETKLSRIGLGDSVDISVDAYPGREFVGTVTLIGAAAASQFSLLPPANASGNFTKVTQRVPIRISIGAPPEGATPGDGTPADPPILLPGMFVEIHIRVGAR
jgi:membrane fusion protein (multidrug efflux system)